ncbi:hypothetical protein [Caballeronia sp. dw_19]|uniref:hypothetical protein n=1 Tax=Caballeronia sp. dw_19 TaxID=2719791 RepID=UPI001BD44724|nr:hypothetical protein [Caballeronia sp. dw_19]
MERFLGTMLDDLVQLALRNGSATLAWHLSVHRAARQREADGGDFAYGRGTVLSR